MAVSFFSIKFQAIRFADAELLNQSKYDGSQREFLKFNLTLCIRTFQKCIHK